MTDADDHLPVTRRFAPVCKAVQSCLEGFRHLLYTFRLAWSDTTVNDYKE